MSNNKGNPPSEFPANAEVADVAKKKGRRRKEKRQVIEISLWINGVKYQYGIMCTFCAKTPAVCHCPECTDFYCKTCDITAHNTKKRKGHIRSILSKLDMDTAGRFITRTVRRFGLLRMLQARCRQLFTRHFDRKTLNYYYFNSVYGTRSWKKPYCLRKFELFPYMTPYYAACKCQNLYYLWRSREKSRNAILDQYKKIFDRSRGEFYYAFNGPSKLLPRSSWKKPRLLGKRSFPRDLLPIYTIDVAAVIIQRKWRTILMFQFFRALVRSTHDEVWDPVKGKFNYYNRDHEVLHVDKPRLLRNEPWDPNRVVDWTVDRVSLFLRRIGLKQYVHTMQNYQVDGRALYLLDDEDFENLNIIHRVHIRKIKVEINRIFKPEKKIVISEEHEARREKIRRQKMYNASAVMIQKHFRKYIAKKELKLKKELFRIQRAEARLQSRVQASGNWWSDNENLPSRKGIVPVFSSTGLKLPPLKTFGRRRDYLSFKGWGRRGDDLQGTWNSHPAMQMDKNFMGDSNPTRIFSEKLHISGYDQKRLTKFKSTLL